MQIPRRRQILPLVPFSSLADMAFILLVFFLLSSHFSGDDPPPVRLARTASPLAEAEHPPLRLFLTATGQLGSGSLTLQVSDALPAPATLALLRQETARRTGTPTLAIDADCPYDLVRRALRLLESLDLSKFSFEMESTR